MKEGKSKQTSDRTKGLIVSFGVTAFLLLTIEIVLRVVGYGHPYTRNDPFMGFEGTNPAFRAEQIPGKGYSYVPSPNKRDLKQSFPAHKPDNTYRVFTFGGSTTYGAPYGLKGSYPSWLQQALSQLYPHKNIEVINTGTRGYGSTRVLQIFKEVVHYEPDLFVVWNGQNEFRDAAFHPWELTRGYFRTTLLKFLFTSRIYYLLVHRGYRPLMSLVLGPRQISYAGSHLAAILSKPFSQETFKSYDYFSVPPVRFDTERSQAHKDTRSIHQALRLGKHIIKAALELGDLAISREEVFAIFRHNSAEMIEIAQGHNIKIIFLRQARNPKGRSALSIPFFNVSRAADWENRTDQWRASYISGVQDLEGRRYLAALQHFENLSRKGDPSQDKLLHLYKGLCYEGLGLYDKASTEFEKRFPQEHLELNAVLEAVTSKYRVPMIDVYQLLKEASGTGIVGYENYFIDDVHMTLEGYKLLATSLARFIHDDRYISNGSSKDIYGSLFFHWEGSTNSGEEEQSFDTSETNTALGWAAFNNGDVEGALERAQKAVVQNPSEIQAHLLLGYVYSRLGKFEEAKAAYNAIARLYRASKN